MIAYSAYKGYKAKKEEKAHEGRGNAAPDEVHGVSPVALQEHYAPPQHEQAQQQQQQYGTRGSTHHVPQYSHSVQQTAYVYPLFYA